MRTVEERGARVVVTATDSDAVARLLLGELGGTDLEVVTAGLEQAFMALTGGTDESQPSGIRDRPGPGHGAKELVR